MKIRRFATGLALLASLVPTAVRSTTANSLRARIAIDGALDDYALDEWVLDATSAFPEPDSDSHWGSDSDIGRVALTWDAEFLYLAVEFRSRGDHAALYLANTAGGVPNLDGAGEFRRAVDLPGLFPNLLALAAPGALPRVAFADAAHPLQLVDRSVIPAAIQAAIDGHVGFEMAIPWSRLAPTGELRLVCAITGAVGSGSGDAAPDPRVVPDEDPLARARLDRWLAVVADANADGVPDAGVSPRAIAVVGTTDEAALPHGDARLNVRVDERAFAPDRNESATFTIGSDAGPLEDVSGLCSIYSVDGRLVRKLAVALAGPVAETTLAWDGRDQSGRIVDGGVFIAAFDLEFTGNGARSRARATIGVAVVR